MVAARPGWSLPVTAGAAPPLQAAIAAGRVHLLAAPPLRWSSTELRATFARGEPPAGALPPPVVDYIRKYRLYR